MANEFLLSESRAVRAAEISDSIAQRPFEVQSLEVDLSNARNVGNSYPILFPFQSVFIRAATDPLVYVNMRVISEDEIQSQVPMKLNDSWDLGRPMPKAYLTWPAQPGKKMTLLFFVSSSFKSGSQLSVNSGGVSISQGSSVQTLAVVTTLAGIRQVIAPANSIRNTCTIQNTTGGDLFVGDSTVTDSTGIKISDGGYFYWKNTSALYGYPLGGGAIRRLEES